MARFTSRKFLLALGVQIIAIGTMLYPQHTHVISEITTNAVALLIAVLAALGYIKAEASIDRAIGGDR